MLEDLRPQQARGERRGGSGKREDFVSEVQRNIVAQRVLGLPRGQ